MSFESDVRAVVAALTNYDREARLRNGPVLRQPPIQQLFDDLDLESYVRSGGLNGDELLKFLKKYLPATTRLRHPAFFAHQTTIPHDAGVLAAVIDSYTANPMAIYEMGPAAAAIEYALINWMLEKVGWRPAPSDWQQHDDEDFGAGVLTNGGSLGNLIALVTARTRMVPDVWREGSPGDLGIMAPAGSHYSVARAAGVIGLGMNGLFAPDVDERGVIIPDRLPEALSRLRAAGRRPLALVANACSTAVGLYDPLQEIGLFCREHDVWFHVDGAHGASMLLSEKHRDLLNGVELADSITWDAHKMMRTPPLCTALLVRDHHSLDRAFQQDASYIFHEKEQPGFDFIHRTIECTKSALGLKLFMVLAAEGERGIADYIDRQLDLTQRAYAYLQRQADFECAVKPQANILCFRLHGDDALQMAVRRELTAQGDYFISTTLFNGKRYLRTVIINPDSSMDDFKGLIDAIRAWAPVSQSA